MFCPGCGTETQEQLKYCKQCGANLRAVVKAMGKSGSGSDSSLGRLGWDQIAMEEARSSIKRKSKITPEEKRLNEIKAGVITSSIGLAFMLFLGILFDAIANTMTVPESEIIRVLWVAGLIPFLIGAGIIFNGWYIGRKIVDLKNRLDRDENDGQQSFAFSSIPEKKAIHGIQAVLESPVEDFSVTEGTTTRLRDPLPVPASRDTDKV